MKPTGGPSTRRRLSKPEDSEISVPDPDFPA